MALEDDVVYLALEKSPLRKNIVAVATVLPKDDPDGTHGPKEYDIYTLTEAIRVCGILLATVKNNVIFHKSCVAFAEKHGINSYECFHNVMAIRRWTPVLAYYEELLAEFKKSQELSM